MEKVILPIKVATAVENLRARGISNKKLLNYPSLFNSTDKDYTAICDYLNLDERNLETWAIAIINGYISDKSPEEKLRDFYDYHTLRNLRVGVSTIEKVLEILEVKIKGINS